MKMEIEITEEDHADFNRFYFVRSKLKSSVFVAFAALIILEIFLNKDGLHLLATVISSLTLVVLYFALIYVAMAATKKVPASEGTVLGTRKIEFTDEGIRCSTHDKSTLSKWSDIKKIEQGFSALYIYTNGGHAYIIPKRYFTGRKEQDEFEASIKEKIGKRPG